MLFGNFHINGRKKKKKMEVNVFQMKIFQREKKRLLKDRIFLL